MMTIRNIDVREMPDEDPDLSWLDCPENYAGLPADEAARYLAQDRERLATYGVDWYCVGIDAVARIDVNGVHQTITSGGLWGIESDSGEDYLREIADEQMDELRGILAAIGFGAADITAAMPTRPAVA